MVKQNHSETVEAIREARRQYERLHPVEPDKELVSSDELSLWDKTVTEGYVWKYQIDIPKWIHETSGNEAQRKLEIKTFLRVQLSDRPDELSNQGDFRLLHDSDRKGEDLAVTISVVATIKDAFIKRKKIKIYSQVSQEMVFEGMFQPPSSVSDLYNAIKSVEIFYND